MERHLIHPDSVQFPSAFAPLLAGATLYDSSCSSVARVYFIDKDQGYYLKTAPKGSLSTEADLTRFFHSKGLGAEVLAYESLAQDWLLTARIPGEDCISPMYLSDPKRLCDTTAELLSLLHHTDPTGCPVPDRTARSLAAAQRNHKANHCCLNLFSGPWTYSTPEEAWKIVEQQGHLLQTDTLLHGDYCLPNLMLDNWVFRGFIDLDTAGIGDRHTDLFWATWSLQFNLKTDAYRNRFLDAYGRDSINEDLFPVIAALEAFL